MANETEILAIPRHPEVPAPSTQQILTGPVIGQLPTYDGGALLLTWVGVAYLPVPWDAQTWAGIAVGGLSGGLASQIGNEVVKAIAEETGKAVAEAVVEEKVIPERIKACLRRTGSFAAGYAEVSRVVQREVKMFGTDSLSVDIVRVGQRKTYKVNFKQELEFEHVARAANCIASTRAFSEGVWAWSYAMSNGSTPPSAADVAAILATENALSTLADRARKAGVKRSVVVKRAMELHPVFAEFKNCAATMEAYDVFTRSWFIDE
jgi:hypothetical protein